MYPGSSEQDYKREVVINTVSVSDPTSPSIDWKVTIEGDYKDSRKIGDTLYIVTENQPEYEYVNFEDQQTLDQYIDQLTLEDYLPNYTINGEDKGLLVAAEDCLVPDISNDNLLIQSTTIVTAINLKDKTIDNNLCIVDRIQTMYMSPSSIYLSRSIHSQDSNSTLLHKITLSESSMAYAASGTVEGRIGWSTPSYFMSENDDYLRILTTLWDSNTNQDVHKLSVLKANDDNLLEQVAQIPNANQPAAIGKPNESIFAVRFWGDRAYVVTFEQTDPLYVIDVSNPLTPNILGELEMPGFSTYLRPLNDNYLFGLGRNDGNDLDGNRLNGGVKVSLYDISDTANPSIAKEFIFGGWGSQTVAGNNPHALNFQFLSDDQVRVSFPLSVYPEGAISEDDGDESTTVSVSISNQEQVHGLALFDINDLTSDAIFTENGMIDTSDTENNSYSGRARIHNDTVFYINGVDVWSADWSTPENATGPQ